MRFYFDIVRESGVDTDEIGVEAGGLAVALAEAMDAIGELDENEGAGWEWGESQLIVTSPRLQVMVVLVPKMLATARRTSARPNGLASLDFPVVHQDKPAGYWRK